MRVEQNSGPYVGRNLAIEASTGEFVAIQDADDWSHPDRFAQQIKCFAESPTTMLVTTPHVRIDKYGRVQMEAQFNILGDGPMTSMFRRTAFDQVGVFARVRSRGDVEMRERMRSYFGNHSLRELELPMMLCFADSATLSQKTKTEKHEFLQLFRSNISNRANLQALRHSNTPLGPRDAIVVPMPLRPTSQGV
jgi:glycosyltransferase involved in cell wall biosynthesis